jgi:hypothetical protein
MPSRFRTSLHRRVCRMSNLEPLQASAFVKIFGQEDSRAAGRERRRSNPGYTSRGLWAASPSNSGTIPATLSDFKIEPPSLLMIPVKNEMPVRVEMTWRFQ